MATRIDELLRTDEVQERIPLLPDFIQGAIRRARDLKEQRRVLQEILASRARPVGKIPFLKNVYWTTKYDMPKEQVEAYRRRIEYILDELAREPWKVWGPLQALRAEYDPYTPPAHYYAGYPERPDGGFGLNGFWDNSETQRRILPLTRIFSSPMPPQVLASYEAAKESRIFRAFIVASPDPDDFTTIRIPTHMDPVLIGYVSTGEMGFGMRVTDGGSVLPGLEVRNGVGFLIRSWDLARDLRIGGVIAP